MKLFVVLAVVAGGYYYFLTHTTDLVLEQAQTLQHQYTYIAAHADELAGVKQ